MRRVLGGHAALLVAGSLLAGCAATPTPLPPRAEPRRPIPPSVTSAPDRELGRPHLSRHSRSPSASLSALHFARTIAVRAHPSGDAVLVGCSEGPTDLRPSTQQRVILAFVARVDPRSGAVRWARHLALSEGAFENGCYTHFQPAYPGPELVSLPRVSVDRAGVIFVSAFAEHTDAELLGAPRDLERGSIVIALGPRGEVRWAHRVSAGNELIGVVAVSATDDGGVDVVTRAFAPDGLDTHSLVHLDAAGRASDRASLTAAPMLARREPCHLGAGGCRVSLEWVHRASDGSLLMYGTMAGVDLSAESSRVASRSTGLHSSGFWACVEPDGRLRWLRATPRILTGIAPMQDHTVLAIEHTASHARVTRVVETRTGALGRWSAAQLDPSSPMARALRLYDVQRRLLVSATWSGGGESRALSGPPIEARVTPEQLERLIRVDHGAANTDLVQLSDGSFAHFSTLFGRLTLGEHAVESPHRMVQCDPGPVGEEHSIPPGGCHEPLERPSAVLISWPAPP